MTFSFYSLSRRLAAASLALLGAAGLSSAWAQASDLSTRSGHSLGLDLSAYTYDEPGVMTLKSRQLGVDYAFTYALGGTWPRSNEGWFVRGELRLATGKADYRSSISGSIDGTGNGYVEARGLVGRDFDRGGYVLAPYVGLGLRQLRNDLRGVSSTGARGYRRASEYTSLPMGLTHRVKLADQSQLATTVEYMHLISGLQTAALSDASASRTDLSLKQRRGHGLRLNVMNRHDNWSWGPTLTYWNIGASDPGGSPAYIEPKNKTYELGLKAAYHF
jgi:hypothetical protein